MVYETEEGIKIREKEIEEKRKRAGNAGKEGRKGGRKGRREGEREERRERERESVSIYLLLHNTSL